MIKYVLVDVHGVLTDGKERKRLIAYLQRKRGMDYDLHNSLWKKPVGECWK